MEQLDGVEDDNSFPGEEIDIKIQEVADEVLKEALWDESKVPHWINQINEKLMQHLVSMQRPYKYMITVVMQQKTNAIISSTNSCYFENTTDGSVTSLFPPPSRPKEHQAKTVQAMITVFGTRF